MSDMYRITLWSNRRWTVNTTAGKVPYGEWCESEAARIGGGAVVLEHPTDPSLVCVARPVGQIAPGIIGGGLSDDSE